MPQYESIINAADFISDHFLTSDDSKASFFKKAKTLRTVWNQAGKEGNETVHSRFTANRTHLVAQLGTLTGDVPPERADDLYANLREVLGYPGPATTYVAERSGVQLTVENVWAEPAGGEAGAGEVLWLSATPADSVEDVVSSAMPLGPVYEGEKAQGKPLGKLISDLYLTEDAPKYIAAMAGRFLLLTERERWPEGRYLAADALLAAERNDTKQGGEIDYLLAVFGRDSLRPAADGTIRWDAILEESVAHSVAVSQDLREGVRRSIEIIANDVLARRGSREGVDGNDLARQSLRYLYRILFLLYAEASPELGVLPVGASEYDAGYGLERLRELISRDLTTEHSRAGTHFYDSLDLLFQLVNGSHHTQTDPVHAAEGRAAADAPTLDFQPLRADLFDPARTALIDETKLSNQALHDVLTRLLLSSEKRGVQRGFVSYANLGVNQLGAVYEGLMSYTGFIADTHLREVAPAGNPEKGSWVVPTTRSDGIEAEHFVQRTDPYTGVEEAVVHRAGSFVFRLAGRERQQSASYYTPEVLTKFVVSQALEEVLDPHTTAAQVLQLTICEPALGSGAFAIEAVRQLADEYLKRRQAELTEQIPAEDYPAELQKVKAHIALHQVYGVDLNATAVELAEVSLWLDTMNAGLQAPWFGLRLKRGNSLVGARRATYSVGAVGRKDYLSEEPAPHPLADLMEAMQRGEQDPAPAGRIHHFLLPGEGWGAAAAAKEIKDLAGDNQKALKTWQRDIKKKLSKDQVSRLKGLAQQVEVLWPIALRRLQVAESEARREIGYWGKQGDPLGTPAVTREEIERKLNDPESIFQRLNRVMDAWTALWFWPVVPDGEKQPMPPDVEEWITVLEGLLGTPAVGRSRVKSGEGQASIFSTASWSELDTAEDTQRRLSGMATVEGLKAEHPWLHACEEIAEEQGIFHWELDFATVFARGGFDLQVGNPPWVRPDWDENAVYAEHDPWWQLASKPTQAEKTARAEVAKSTPEHVTFMCQSAVAIAAFRNVLTSATQYPIVAELRPDLYRSFMERTWRSAHKRGAVALLHPESHFTEKKAALLRAETYRRLRRHWQFINELKLFEIHNLVTYGVHIYGHRRDQPRFRMAASLYHPETVERSLRHEGGTEIPGLKDADDKWDTRPHPERILTVTQDVLETWASILDEPGTPPLHARMVYPVNKTSESVLEKLAQAPRVRELDLQYSSGWNETVDRRKGYFEVGSRVNDSWNDVILQGPHFSVANPFAKQPNPTMRSNRDSTELDLEALPADFIPRTSYQPNRDMPYDQDYTVWEIHGHKIPARSVYRLGWRRMAATTGFRTLYPTVIPPGAAHVHPVYCAGPFPELAELATYVGLFGSIPYDFYVRVSGSSEIQYSLIGGLPRAEWPEAVREVQHRAGRLACLTTAYAPLWEEVMGEPWTPSSPTRIAAERRQLLVELDALAALSLGLTADELCTIYRTQFPVLRDNEQADLYDANGRKVPGEMNRQYRKVGQDGMTAEDVDWTHPQSGVTYTYEFPFRQFDREVDMRAAYAGFQEEFG